MLDSGEEDGTRQTPMQVPTEGRTRGNVIVPQVFIPVEYFCNTCQWFESHTLVG